MSDVRLVWDNNALQGTVRFDRTTNDLETDDGLESLVLVSLFTDALAAGDDPLPDSLALVKDRRGWWADHTSDRENDSVGSKLWLLERAKVSQENLRRAEKYAKAALQWMIDEGVAVKIDAVAWVTGIRQNQLGLEVRITRSTGTVKSLRFESLWEETVQ
jgi:phage gp46-like protein